MSYIEVYRKLGQVMIKDLILHKAMHKLTLTSGFAWFLPISKYSFMQ